MRAPGHIDTAYNFASVIYPVRYSGQVVFFPGDEKKPRTLTEKRKSIRLHDERCADDLPMLVYFIGVVGRLRVCARMVIETRQLRK